jgi:hypothetical protein
MKQAKVIGGKKITTTDTGIYNMLFPLVLRANGNNALNRTNRLIFVTVRRCECFVPNMN